MIIDLYVIVERGMFDSDAKWLSVLQGLAGLEVPGLALQVRTKQCPGADHERLAREAAACTRDSPVPVLLNGSEQLATSLGFAGVHWPEADIPAQRCKGGLAGASVHSLHALRRAEVAAADFAVFGTVFAAGSKPVDGVGVSALRALASAAAIPLLAIGGVTPERVRACLVAGASGVAAVTGVLHARDPAAAVAAYVTALREARSSIPPHRPSAEHDRSPRKESQDDDH